MTSMAVRDDVFRGYISDLNDFEIMEEGFRLIRLEKISANNLQNRVQKVWEQVLGSGSMDVQAVMGELDKDPDVKDIYISYFNSDMESDVVKAWVAEFHSDSEAVGNGPPIQKASAGFKGQTNLVQYQVQGKIRSYVLKYTNSEEYPSHLLYSSFVKGTLSGQEVSPGFQVPAAAAPIDLNDVNSFARGPLLELSELMKIYNLGPNTSALVTERVSGVNLSDFIFEVYPKKLDDDKKGDFFRRLGRIALLDLVLGNTDRLLRFLEYSTDPQEALETIEANLGNLMVDSTDSLEFYLIDNEVYNHESDAALLLQEKAQKYTAFFNVLINRPDFLSFVFKSTQSSVESALSDGGSLGEVQSFMKEFSSRKEDFEKGIQTMIAILQQTDYSNTLPEIFASDFEARMKSLSEKFPIDQSN